MAWDKRGGTGEQGDLHPGRSWGPVALRCTLHILHFTSVGTLLTLVPTRGLGLQ